MEEIIKQKCESMGIDPSVLTSDELEKLKEEIKAEKHRYTILDGVLSNPDLYYRTFQKNE